MATRFLVTLLKSVISRPADQRATVRSLGLRKLHQQVALPDTPVVRGMLHKVRHLVQVDRNEGLS